MATLLTLRDRLDGWAGRTDADYLARRDLFINQAIREMAERVGDEAGLTNILAAVAVAQGDLTIPIPDTLRSTADMRVILIDGTTRTELTPITADMLVRPFWDEAIEDEVDLTDTTVQGTPLYFAAGLSGADRALFLRRPPDKAYTAELRGVKFSTDLSAEGDDNYITVEAEDAVLYLALSNAWDFLEDFGRGAHWRARAEPLVRRWIGHRLSSAVAPGRLQIGTYEV